MTVGLPNLSSVHLRDFETDKDRAKVRVRGMGVGVEGVVTDEPLALVTRVEHEERLNSPSAFRSKGTEGRKVPET